MSEKIPDTVKISRLEKVIKAVKKETSLNAESSEISFEYLVASCFPMVWKNVQNVLKDSYTKGYIQGFEEGRAFDSDKRERDG